MKTEKLSQIKLKSNLQVHIWSFISELIKKYKKLRDKWRNM